VRILHILDHSLPLHSGYTFRTLSILREQGRLGWETSHLTGPKQDSAERLEETVDGWHFFRTPLGGTRLAGLPAVAELRMMNALTHRLQAVAQQIKPQLLHAHSPALNAIPALRVGRRLGVPVVYEVRAFWEDAAVDHGRTREGAPRYRLTRALETYALKRADAVTTICEGLRSDIVARGIDPQKVTVVPNAVDLEMFTLGREPDEALRRRLELDGAVVLGFIGLSWLRRARSGTVYTSSGSRGSGGIWWMGGGGGGGGFSGGGGDGGGFSGGGGDSGGGGASGGW